MKFQNSSIHGFKVMLCIKKRDERTDGRTNNSEAICPSNFFEVGGIKRARVFPTILHVHSAKTEISLHLGHSVGSKGGKIPSVSK